jgi:hypothetical protein
MWKWLGKLLGREPKAEPSRYRDSAGNPTPEALDDEQAGVARGASIDERARMENEGGSGPRYEDR